MAKKRNIHHAAKQIADIIEEHLAKLTPEEREQRLNAFYAVGAKVRASRAKSESPS